MRRPSAAELRPVVHPAGVKDRRSGEHWAGRLYMREVSLRIDPYLVNTRVTPNQLTYLMVLTGILGGAVLLVPGLLGAVLAVVLFQVYLLLDCVDGEVARWRGQTSVTGVYLDRVGHYLCEAALLIGFGLRGADVFRHGGGAVSWLWAFLGTLAALGAILVKAETDLVDVARQRSGLPAVTDSASAPRSAGLALARRAAAALRFHRLVGGIEASLLVLLAAVLDACAPTGSGLFFTRLGVVVLAAVAVAQTVLHLVSILASSRLRAEEGAARPGGAPEGGPDASGHTAGPGGGRD
ncbi:CDP-alcohol phosphatidyltransferase family protein [Streptomyces fuscigenes]|uniref:CDP-alcohol phosphatidyltransferase family protein n=1 Tax=Streptomyces fuscigenes TaxID=1528880 RepID=UPI001F43FD6C|nr:CDP-alcohol phosphatidyltransferase family protein [Streptomyces fuscigenes]MCF3961693.1 CDP-alcohol phosphatidyltransferase family protein [Streptomyces fuscigenes]